MKKQLIIIGALFVVAFVLTGCNPPETPSTPQASAQNNAEEEKKPVQTPTDTPASSSVEDLIKQAFAQKNSRPVSEITVSISAQDDTHARGMVSFAPGGSENSGLFLAAREMFQWRIIFSGNGNAPCDGLAAYGFSANLLKGICDPQPAAAKTSNDTMIVKVYFNNPDIDPNWDYECSNVLPVERTIPKTTSVALAAIKELLKGPTAAEKAKGYLTSVNTGVIVQKLTIENGIAKIDFNEKLQYQVGGSCKTSAIIAQIKQTLKQFSSVKEVIISIDGVSDSILQP